MIVDSSGNIRPLVMPPCVAAMLAEWIAESVGVMVDWDRSDVDGLEFVFFGEAMASRAADMAVHEIMEAHRFRCAIIGDKHGDQ